MKESTDSWRWILSAVPDLLLNLDRSTRDHPHVTALLAVLAVLGLIAVSVILALQVG
jgi:hypothetical protein